MWRPGKIAESLRAASCLCAQNIIHKFISFDDTILKQVNLLMFMVHYKN